MKRDGIGEKLLELISMISTFFGLLLMGGAPLGLFLIGDPRINPFILIFICVVEFIIGYGLFNVRKLFEDKYDIFL